MASIGLKYFYWAKMKDEPAGAVPTYETGKVIGKAVSTNLTITNSEGELYADDMLAEYVSEFSSGDFSAETDNITLQDQAALYGATYSDNEIQFGSQDTAPYGCFGGVQVLMVRGARKFRAWFFAKAKASIPDWTGATKGNSVSFATQPIRMKIMAPEFGPWYRIKEFDTEEAAKAYIETAANVAVWHQVSVQTQGAGSSSVVGAHAVANGETLAISLSPAPTVLYDNGEDKTSSASGGVYTIANVTESHNVAVIF